MKHNGRVILFIAYILLGGVLVGLGFAEIVDSFWSGMGSAFLIIGALRLLRLYRFRKNESYREKMEVAEKDERNHFIRSKAWAWAGYLFIMACGAAVIVLKLMGLEEWSLAAGCGVCLLLLLYWISYLILQKKY